MALKEREEYSLPDFTPPGSTSTSPPKERGRTDFTTDTNTGNTDLEDAFEFGENIPKLGSFFKIVGIGANFLLNIWGTGKEEQQQKKFIALREKELRSETGLSREALALQARRQKFQEGEALFQRRQARKMWKWKDEEKNYNRAQEVVNRFTSLLDRRPAFANNLVNLWPRR